MQPPTLTQQRHEPRSGARTCATNSPASMLCATTTAMVLVPNTKYSMPSRPRTSRPSCATRRAGRAGDAEFFRVYPGKGDAMCMQYKPLRPYTTRSSCTTGQAPRAGIAGQQMEAAVLKRSVCGQQEKHVCLLLSVCVDHCENSSLSGRGGQQQERHLATDAQMWDAPSRFEQAMPLPAPLPKC